MMHALYYSCLQIKCMKCQGKSERQERMMDLTVEIEGDIRSLEEALRRFSGTEILDGENKYQCGRLVKFTLFCMNLQEIGFVGTFVTCSHKLPSIDNLVLTIWGLIWALFCKEFMIWP